MLRLGSHALKIVNVNLRVASHRLRAVVVRLLGRDDKAIVTRTGGAITFRNKV